MCNKFLNAKLFLINEFLHLKAFDESETLFLALPVIYIYK